MRRSIVTAFAVVVLVTAFAVGGEAQRRHRPVRRCHCKPVAVDSSGAVKTASGLTYLITQHGTGRAPKAGELVLVNYTGMFTTGVKFDSSVDPPRGPLPFTLGASEVIKGWDEGISKLHIGDKAILVIPPAIAYGAKGAGDVIPPNTTLVFMVELVDVKASSLSKILFETLKTSGSEAMLARYHDLKTKGLGDVYSSESDLNGLGYKLMRMRQFDNGIAVFKLIVEEYPTSANAYDSLGEAYAITGQKQLAIEAYEKALKIDPKFTSSIEALQKLRQP